MTESRNELSAERRRKRLAGESPDDPNARLRSLGVDPSWLVNVFDCLVVWCVHDYRDFKVSSDLAAEAAGAGIEELMAAMHRPRSKPLHFEVEQQFDAWAKQTARRAAKRFIVAACEHEVELVIDTSFTDETDELVPELDRLSSQIFEHELAELPRCPSRLRYNGKAPSRPGPHTSAAAVDHVSYLTDEDDAPEWVAKLA